VVVLYNGPYFVAIYSARQITESCPTEMITEYTGSLLSFPTLGKADLLIVCEQGIFAQFSRVRGILVSSIGPLHFL
jgi:hypothetical protein